jgi:cytochrome c oxidase subunit 2
MGFSSVAPRASTIAGSVDAVFWGITLVCVFFAVLVAALVITFAVRYRQGNRVNRTLPGHEGIALELTWTLIPLVIAMGLFLWSASVYFQIITVPKGAMEVYVVGKQWMWKLQHPSGRWEMNELHVPVGRPVKLTMISEDVIHSFGIPAFRVKQDVLPGRYTQLWFTPTKTGRFHLFCSEFCGTNHAIMGGYVTVMEPGDFDKWMQTGNTQTTLATAGERLFRERGCTGCHGPNATVRAPALEGIYNRPVAIQVPDEGNRTRTIQADERYIHDSIVLPEKEIAAGYPAIMPSYKGRLSEEELVQLVEYIKTLGVSNGTSNGSARGYVAGTAGTGPSAIGASGAASGLNGGSATNRKGNPTGDMSNYVDREAILGGIGSLGTGGGSGRKGNPTGDMSNYVDREAVFRGGADVAAQSLAENAAGGSRPEVLRRRGLQPYNSDNYVQDSTRVYTGGLQPSGRLDSAGNIRGNNTPSTSTQSGAKERERTGR